MVLHLTLLLPCLLVLCPLVGLMHVWIQITIAGPVLVCAVSP